MSGISDASVGDRFAAGQLWTYRTREGEESSRAIVLHVEEFPSLGCVAHVALVDLAIRCPSSEGGFLQTLRHLPVAASSLHESLCELQLDGLRLPDPDEICGEWRRAFETSGAGCWTLPLAEIVQAIEDGFASTDSDAAG